MLDIPVLRWGKPYDSLEKDTVVHFETGEELARVSQANAAMVQRDLRKVARAREVLREIPIPELLGMMDKAADLYMRTEPSIPVLKLYGAENCLVSSYAMASNG